MELKESSIAAGSVAMLPRCGVQYSPKLPAQSLHCPGSLLTTIFFGSSERTKKRA